jgi:antitoxin component HigA of HigAB toxin-antitoxin module
LLSTLAENWEEAHHPILEAPGYRILKNYMQVRGLRQIDLKPILGSLGNGPDWMETRIHAIQVVSKFSILHFSVESITHWSGICVIK